MENVLKYYEFSDFFKDNSGVFNENEICYTILNDTHFLIFEKEKETKQYNLYVSRFKNDKEIGFKKPEILESVVKKYDKSSPEHRIALRKYVE
jgi:hypothetical protein